VRFSSQTIRNTAEKIWQRYALHREWLQGDSSRFPWRIHLRVPAGKKLVEQLETLQIETERLKTCQENHPDFEIEYTQISNRLLGRQRVPDVVTFTSRGDVLSFLRKDREWNRFTKMASTILQRFPILKAYFIRYPAKVLEYENCWDTVLNICRYRIENPAKSLYIRQISVPDVDTKFVETHKGLLKDLFDRLLPEKSIHHEFVGLRNHGFEQRFGFQFDPSRIRLRILDAKLSENFSGITDIEIPLTLLIQLNFAARKIFITENKMNGLTFPNTESAVVLFGLGYGIQILKEIPWLTDKSLYYWGDIDTHGFNILSKLRSYFPAVQSFLMNETTLLSHRNHWVNESTPTMEQSMDLNEPELKLYQNLVDNFYGDAVRLEQERIRYSDVVMAVDKL